MFRLTACARVSAHTGSRLKTAAPFLQYDGFELPVTTRFLVGGRFVLSKYFVGEFMRSFIAAAALAIIAVGQPAIAEEVTSHDAVRIETNQQAKAFVFIIDDEPVAILDKNGLQVVEHLSYGRSLTDKGPDGVRREIADLLKEAADE